MEPSPWVARAALVGAGGLLFGGVARWYLMKKKAAPRAAAAPPAVSRKHDAIRMLRWPVFGLVAFAAICKFSGVAMTVFPSIFSSYRQQGAQGFDDAEAFEKLPPIKSFTHAFELGQVWRQMYGTLIGSDEENDALAAFSKAVNASEVMSRDEVSRFPLWLQHKVEASNNASSSIVLPALSGIRGLFTVVNIIWGFAILGLSVLSIPVFFVLFGRFFERHMRQIVDGLITLLEPFSYVVSLFLAVESLRYLAAASPNDITLSGPMYAFASSMAFAASWTFSVCLHSTGGGHFSDFLIATSCYMTPLVTTLAVVHESTFLGSTAMLWLLLGLCSSEILSGFLASLTQFKSDSLEARVASASQFLSLSLVAARAAPGVIPPSLIDVFTPAGSVVSTAVYFTSLLACTETQKNGDLVYIANFVLFLALGEMTQTPDMSLTAKSYFAIYALRRVLGVVSAKVDDVTIPAFLTCVVTYFGSLYLHVHPEYIRALCQ